jgi:hypothetical protein
MPDSGNSGAFVNVPPFRGAPRRAAEVWTVRKGARAASCHLWTHPTAARPGSR